MSVERARRWVSAFSQEPLNNTIYSRQLLDPLEDLVNLHEKPMPWKVRLYVLVHGVIPESYLENSDDS